MRVFLRILDRLEEILIATLMAGATLVIFVAVVHRYGSGVSFLYPILHKIHLSWAQELCIYMFVWMAKFGAAYGVRTGIHVGVDVLVLHEGPSHLAGGEGNDTIRERLVRARVGLTVFGHTGWRQPLAELSDGVQALNVHERVVIATL